MTFALLTIFLFFNTDILLLYSIQAKSVLILFFERISNLQSVKTFRLNVLNSER
jgi:hypothetical protein